MSLAPASTAIGIAREVSARRGPARPARMSGIRYAWRAQYQPQMETVRGGDARGHAGRVAPGGAVHGVAGVRAEWMSELTATIYPRTGGGGGGGARVDPWPDVVRTSHVKSRTYRSE